MIPADLLVHFISNKCARLVESSLSLIEGPQTTAHASSVVTAEKQGSPVVFFACQLELAPSDLHPAWPA